MLRSCLAALLVAPLAAQSFVVPKVNATAAGNNYDNFVFYGTVSQQPTRVQLLYNVTDVTPPAALIKAMNLRRTSAIGNANPAATANVTITMSVGPLDAVGATTTFASNHGPSPVQVFSGNVNLPSASQAPGPAPFVVNIPFSNSFPYVASAGSALVVDIATTSYTPGTGTASWYLDEQGVGQGARVSNPSAQSTCRFSNGNYNNVIGWAGTAAMIPGGRWYVSYQNLLPNAPGFAALGNQGVGGSWNGIPLPFSLAALGAPGCSWNVNVLFSLPLLASATGIASWPTLNIPNDQALANVSIYDHAAFIDLAANALGLVTVWSSKWTIGDGTLPEGAKVYRLADTGGSPTGTKVREAIVAEFLH
jgi:hypothetical protein